MSFSAIRVIKDLYFSNFPPYVVFFVTAKCNARCKMCFYWQQIEKSSEKKELTLDEINKISKKMPRFYSLAISGGEPFLRNDLAQIGKIFALNNQVRHISIPTNGLLTKSILEQTRDLCLSFPQTRVEIEFSLDGTQNIHDEIRNVPGIFNQAIKSIEQLIELEKELPNLRVKINTTFSKLNQNNIVELIDFIKNNLGVSRAGISVLHGAARQKEVQNYDLELYKKAVDYLIKKRITSDKINFFDILMISIKHQARNLLIRAIEKNKYPLKCHALKKFLVINEAGLVFPCEPVNVPLGSLRENDYSILKILSSKKARAFSAQNCYCTWGCSVLNNVLYSPFNLFAIFIISFKYFLKKK